MAVVTAPEPQTWQDHAEAARKLVEEVKSVNLDGKDDQSGIDSGEKAKEARTKMEQAVAYAKRAKEMRKENDADYTKMLLERFDLDDSNADSVWGADKGSGGQKGLITSTSEFDPLKQEMRDGGASADPFAEMRKSKIIATEKALDRLNLKALAEGTAASGGFLVPPAFLQDMFAEVRRAGNTLRRLGWLNVHPVETNQVLLPKGSGAATVGWVAENATKPSADQAFGQVTVNIFTAAGISKLSKQLVDDSSPTAVDLATRELASLMSILEEQAVINGSGTGQPRGILQTSGVNNVPLATNTATAIVDAILDAIVAIQSGYFGAPTGVLMHPRRMGFIQKAKDNNGQYLFTGAGLRSPGGAAGLGIGQAAFELLGLPVGISANIPTNLGAGTNQDAIVVGDWTEAHWFQRQEVQLDASDVAGTAFEQNQVWFRLEQRAGFSAERYPGAFAAVTGAGLVP